jgi:hypothetical protein
MKISKQEEREFIEDNYTGKPYAIYIVLFIALCLMVVAGTHLFAAVLYAINQLKHNL